MHSSDWPRTHYVSEGDFELVILLPLLSAGIAGMNHHTWFYVVLSLEPRASCMLGKHSVN